MIDSEKERNMILDTYKYTHSVLDAAGTLNSIVQADLM